MKSYTSYVTHNVHELARSGEFRLFGRIQIGEFRQFGRIQTMRANSDRANSDILTPEEDLVHEQVYRLAFSQCFFSIGCAPRIACHGTVRFVGIFFISVRWFIV